MRRAGSRAWRSRQAPLAVGVLVALLAALALTVTHHAPRPAIPADRAVQTALRDAKTRQALAGSHWTRATAEPLDAQTERVAFFAGARLVAEVALERDGTVLAGVNDRALRVPYGDWIAYEPALLVGLCALFALMTGVTPWRRLRNLDVVASLSLVVGVVLFQHRYLNASLLVTAPGMAYLLGRCARRALGPPREEPASTPLLAAITPGFDPARRVRWLRATLVILGLIVAMIGLSSTDPVDVIFAVMEGATRMVHGVLPYGHMPPGIIHGDTYPILSYALYTPLALLSPVNTLWDSVDAGLAVAVLAALVAAWAVFRMIAGRRPARPTPRPVQAEEAGLRAALAWLAFPPVLITVSTGTTDVTLAAMLAIAVLLWRRPTACNGMLALAGWFKLAPFALVARVAGAAPGPAASELAGRDRGGVGGLARDPARSGRRARPGSDGPRRRLPVLPRLAPVGVERAGDRGLSAGRTGLRSRPGRRRRGQASPRARVGGGPRADGGAHRGDRDRPSAGRGLLGVPLPGLGRAAGCVRALRGPRGGATGRRAGDAPAIA